MTRYHWLWLGAAIGLALHALGLGWDVYMHAQDSTLAAREGIFTIENPSHALIIAGVAIATVCIIGVAITWLNERHVGGDGPAATLLRVSSLPVIAVVGAASIWLVSLSEDSSSHSHDEGTVAHVHDDGSTHEHAAGLDQWVLNALAGQGVTVAADGHTHAAAATGTTEQTTAAESEQGAPQHAHSEIDVAPEDLMAAANFVEASMAAAPRWEDLSDAMAMGYIQVTQDLPGIAAHFFHPGYNSDGIQLDPNRPEVLLYTKRLDGTWRFIGYQFTTEGFPEQSPQHFGALDAWHFHENLCFVAGGRVTIAESDAACAGVFQARTNWMLHVWTEPGATGVFAHDFAPISPGPFPPASQPAAVELAALIN